jgi:hypothetical protein
MAQMSEELIEQWADATAEIYNESLSGISLTRMPAAVAQYIELFAQSENLTFTREATPLDYFERHPFLAVSAILNNAEALEALTKISKKHWMRWLASPKLGTTSTKSRNPSWVLLRPTTKKTGKPSTATAKANRCALPRTGWLFWFLVPRAKRV